ncbi:hypothetical protein [Thioalkalivibrio sulfidiphilus]|uniref:hypothetical protein n=1 Tax=Thioalkalivibrio sulfidiphilus TaxID=1033854 RepID=UPI000371A721|nr:hypothetical protein [Thioalkalivibrio sulfidiphilus]
MSEPRSRHTDSPYLAAFQGGFSGVLRWHQLDALWERLRARAGEGWYVYAVGEPPPESPADAESLLRFIGEVDALLRREHDEDYCGVVYADDLQQPRFVKIYDPNHLGSSCGSSGLRVLPGWTLSLIPPVDLPEALPQTGSRRRWWQKLFGSGK